MARVGRFLYSPKSALPDLDLVCEKNACGCCYSSCGSLNQPGIVFVSYVVVTVVRLSLRLCCCACTIPGTKPLDGPNLLSNMY